MLKSRIKSNDIFYIAHLSDFHIYLLDLIVDFRDQVNCFITILGEKDLFLLLILTMYVRHQYRIILGKYRSITLTIEIAIYLNVKISTK